MYFSLDQERIKPALPRICLTPLMPYMPHTAIVTEFILKGKNDSFHRRFRGRLQHKVALLIQLRSVGKFGKT
jgi:hypothetical protein